MALKSIKIERLEQQWEAKPWKMSKSRKKLKKERNRKLRRTPVDQPVATKQYTDYEY